MFSIDGFFFLSSLVSGFLNLWMIMQEKPPYHPCLVIIWYPSIFFQLIEWKLCCPCPSSRLGFVSCNCQAPVEKMFYRQRKQPLASPCPSWGSLCLESQPTCSHAGWFRWDIPAWALPSEVAEPSAETKFWPTGMAMVSSFASALSRPLLLYMLIFGVVLIKLLQNPATLSLLPSALSLPALVTSSSVVQHSAPQHLGAFRGLLFFCHFALPSTCHDDCSSLLVSDQKSPHRGLLI